MLIGIIGAPNKGKSTLFSALTLANAQIADYPFTTIKPNFGVAYVARPCPEMQLGVKCNPKNSTCSKGTRYIPINIVDIAGLVPGAHLGKGMGNQFLSDAIAADVLIQVVDLSAKTDENGNHVENSDPAKEVEMILDEISKWIASIIKKHQNALAKKKELTFAVTEALGGLKISKEQVETAMRLVILGSNPLEWKGDEIEKFARELAKISKPIIIAANKSDIAPKGALEELRRKLPGMQVFGCSAAIELALKKAAKAGMIDYISGQQSFAISQNASSEQKKALEFMLEFIKKEGTGVQELLSSAVFNTLDLIAVYPVEDENKYTDHFGNVLPDVRLIKKGSTALDLASTIHSDLAKNFLYAIDAKKKMRISKEHALLDQDVIKIASAAK